MSTPLTPLYTTVKFLILPSQPQLELIVESGQLDPTTVPEEIKVLGKEKYFKDKQVLENLNMNERSFSNKWF